MPATFPTTDEGKFRQPKLLLSSFRKLAGNFRFLLCALLLMFGFSRLPLPAMEVLHSFSCGTNGMNPRAPLFLGPDGAFYGTTEQGGAGGYGSIFKLTTNGVLSTLFSFSKTNGANPYGGLVTGTDGQFYGTTYFGGASDAGTIFRFTTNGLHKVLFSLGSPAAFPAGLILGTDGDFYGVTFGGTGSDTYGKVFKFHVAAGANSGTMTTLRGFNTPTLGAYPTCDLIQSPDGPYYGTTASGGDINGGYGTIFRVTSNGTFSSLGVFNKTNGSDPNAGLAFGNDNNLYGTTRTGGTNGLGTVFKVTTNGIITPLLSFNGTNGASPQGQLVRGLDGSFFGTTSQGGPTGNGTLFRITTNGVLTTLYSFTGDQGAYPFAGLRFGPDGWLYGCTYNGFAFKLSTNGDFENLASFHNGDGATPYATLVAGPDGKLYGTTYNGGLFGNGTLYRVSTNADVSIVASFAGTNGASPYSGVRFDASGSLFGVTVFGSKIPKGNGTLYRATTNGIVTGLDNFTGTNGANPYGSVALASGGRIYGTTRFGGSANLGAVFAAKTNGGIAALYSLTTGSGNYPYAGLTFGADARLYGATFANIASFFSMTTNGVFTGASLALAYNNPYGTPLIGPGGLLFGTAERDHFGYGVIYRATTNGDISTVYRFLSSTNGAYPRSDLMTGPDGCLYGSTYQGGLFNCGTIFKVTTNGVLTSLLSFDGTNGMNPQASVVLASDGYLYGTTTRGGAFSAGVVYRFPAVPVLLSQPVSQTKWTGATALFTASIEGVPPFAYQWFKDGEPLVDGTNVAGSTTGTLQLDQLTAGDSATYTLTVSNAFGSITTLPAILQILPPPGILLTDGNFGISSNGFGFSITSSLGSILSVQSSSNLIDWDVLRIYTNDGSPLFFLDSNPNQPSRFFRLSQQQ